MNDDHDFDMKDLYDDPPWAQVIRDLQASRVCFYPGRQANAPDFDDFIGALPHIGNCDALVYAEPRLTMLQVRQQVERHRGNPQIRVAEMGFITNIEIVTPIDMPDEDHRALFGQLGTGWVPPEAKPQGDRFWGLYSRLTLASRTIHLLHIGLAGHAAWAHFLQHHGIPIATVIANPPYQ